MPFNIKNRRVSDGFVNRLCNVEEKKKYRLVADAKNTLEAISKGKKISEQIQLFYAQSHDLKQLVGYNKPNPGTKEETKIKIIGFRIQAIIETFSEKEQEKSALKRQLEQNKEDLTSRAYFPKAKYYITNTVDLSEDKVNASLNVANDISKKHPEHERLNFMPIILHPNFNQLRKETQKNIFIQMANCPPHDCDFSPILNNDELFKSLGYYIKLRIMLNQLIYLFNKDILKAIDSTEQKGDQANFMITKKVISELAKKHLNLYETQIENILSNEKTLKYKYESYFLDLILNQVNSESNNLSIRKYFGFIYQIVKEMESNITSPDSKTV